MIDFLKLNPYVTKEEYMWEWSVPQIKLASFDFSHVVYLSEKQIEQKNAIHITGEDENLNDVGIPILM